MEPCKGAKGVLEEKAACTRDLRRVCVGGTGVPPTRCDKPCVFTLDEAMRFHTDLGDQSEFG